MDDSPSAFEDIYAKLRVSRKVDLLKNVAREKLYDENLISAQKGGMQKYEPLEDSHLQQFFNNPWTRKHLIKLGLIERSGKIVDSKEFQKNQIRLQHKRNMLKTKNLELQKKLSYDIHITIRHEVSQNKLSDLIEQLHKLELEDKATANDILLYLRQESRENLKKLGLTKQQINAKLLNFKKEDKKGKETYVKTNGDNDEDMFCNFSAKTSKARPKSARPKKLSGPSINAAKAKNSQDGYEIILSHKLDRTFVLEKEMEDTNKSVKFADNSKLQYKEHNRPILTRKSTGKGNMIQSSISPKHTGSILKKNIVKAKNAGSFEIFGQSKKMSFSHSKEMLSPASPPSLPEQLAKLPQDVEADNQKNNASSDVAVMNDLVIENSKKSENVVDKAISVDLDFREHIAIATAEVAQEPEIAAQSTSVKESNSDLEIEKGSQDSSEVNLVPSKSEDKVMDIETKQPKAENDTPLKSKSEGGQQNELEKHLHTTNENHQDAETKTESNGKVNHIFENMPEDASRNLSPDQNMKLISSIIGENLTKIQVLEPELELLPEATATIRSRLSKRLSQNKSAVVMKEIHEDPSDEDPSMKVAPPTLSAKPSRKIYKSLLL